MTAATMASRRSRYARRQRRSCRSGVPWVGMEQVFPETTVSGIAAGLHIIARVPERDGPAAPFVERLAAEACGAGPGPGSAQDTPGPNGG